MLSAKARHWCLPATDGAKGLIALSSSVSATHSFRVRKQPLSPVTITQDCVSCPGGETMMTT